MSHTPEVATDEVRPILDWLKLCTDCIELDLSLTADNIVLWVCFKGYKIEVAFERVPPLSLTVAEVLEVVKNAVQSVSQECIIS